jgi:hypothetical protein
MQSTNLKEIKAALWEQAFIGGTRVSCPMGGVVAIRRRKGQLPAMIRGWYPVESVTIERLFARPFPSLSCNERELQQGRGARYTTGTTAHTNSHSVVKSRR